MEALCCLRSRPVAKGEFLDPNVTFMTYEEWKKSTRYTGALRVGIQDMEAKEERVLEVKEPGEDFLNHVIVQCSER
jgi:hypothetical protein